MYRCNLTGELFEVPREVKNSEYGNEEVCPCCGDTDFDIVLHCDICGAYVTEDEGALTSASRTNICPDCRRASIVTLFDFGAGELGICEEEYLDSLLEIGNSWSDLKKLYKEAKQC